MSERLVVVHPDQATLVAAAAARFLTRLCDVQAVRSPAHVVLTGGTVGIALLAAVADHPVRDAVDWSDVHVWWGDERFLPEGDADRNETQAREALLAALPLPAANVHAIPAAPGLPEDSAAAYAAELRAHAPDGADVPAFDLLLLGMGPDAHVASLFPGHAGLEAPGVVTAVHDSPKPPPLRVSLTFAAITRAREVWVVASGAEKASAVAAGLAPGDLTEAPVRGAHGTERTLWLLDAAAAAGHDGDPARR